MLDQKGFDLWADGYDASVGLSDEEGTYPFAGYRAVLNAVYKAVMEKPGARILDVGFGTGVLTSRLYENGFEIWGQDFSGEMLSIAREKMPLAHLYQGDFSKGLAPEILENTYDFIVATYSLHHLTDDEKPAFIRTLLSLLVPGGKLLIGDVAFVDQTALDACRKAAGDEWDDEEYYFTCDSFKKEFPGAQFESFSHCAGLLTLTAFRPMLRRKQQLTNEECLEVLKSEPRGVLSVLGDGGYPYGMPMNFWYDEESGHIYFHGGKSGHKIDAIEKCDKVSFCVYDEGYRREGEWALNIKSVIVFGRIRPVTDYDRAMEVSRLLSYKFISDSAYIECEIKNYGSGTLCLELIPEHMTGKLVNES